MAAKVRSTRRFISSLSNTDHDTKTFLTRMLLLAMAAILVGHRAIDHTPDDRASPQASFPLLDRLDSATHYFVVPLYTVLAILYLTAVAFRQDLRSFLDLVRRQSRSVDDVLRNLRAGGPPGERPHQKGDEAIELPGQLFAVDGEAHDDDDKSHQQPVDLTGVYRLVSNDNFEAFLAAQGVPWALRSAANRARPTHRIAHRGRVLTIKIEGIIESQTTYLIDGPPVETNVRGRIFEDVVNYLDGGRKGIIVRKRALTEDYDVTVQRELSDDGAVITMTSTATFRDSRPFVQSKQIFHRVIE